MGLAQGYLNFLSRAPLDTNPQVPFLRRPSDHDDVGSTPTLVVHVVASLEKAFYDDYFCLVASNKQQITW